MTVLNPLAQPRSRSLRQNLSLTPIAALVLGIVTAILCRSGAGVSLGLFFGGIGFAALLVPPLAAGESTGRRRALVATPVAVGTAAVWLTALGELVTLRQWVACSVVMIAFALALAGGGALLLALRVQPVLAACPVTLAGLLWLTWPVWLSPVLRGPFGDALAAWLIPAHPLFAVNAVLSHFDTWDRYPLAYGSLTVLNQDVFYALPAGVHWAALAHASVGLLSFGTGRLLESRRERRHAARPTAPPAPPA